MRSLFPLLLLAAACTTVGPDYQRPTMPLPAAFHEGGPGLSAAAADLSRWWRRLGDPLLDELIGKALAQGLDARQALARVAEARARAGVAAAGQWPALDARAGYQRLGTSENTPFGAFAQNYDQYTAGFDAGWEVDLWGRVRRSVEAADAELAASIEQAAAAMVTVTAEVARNYVELRALQQRLRIANDNLDLQQQTLQLVQARFQSGLVGERDVAQARSNLATTRARVPALEAAARAAEHRLSVLLGEVPGSLAERLAAPQPVPTPPTAIAVGVPNDVVRLRPDVRAAERELAAATARIGVAEAELYPQLSLIGSVGLESDRPRTLFETASSVFAFGPQLRWNLFDGGAARRQVDAQRAIADQALVRWQRAVLQALEESENAMAAFVREQTRRGHLAEAAEQGRRAVTFAETQYREGLTDFQNVLDSERALAEIEDQLAQSSASIVTQLIALYKALGGGAS